MSPAAVLTAKLGSVAALIGAVTLVLTNAEALATAQPFVLKIQLAQQQRESGIVKNVERADELDYQIDALENQLAMLRRQHGDHPNDTALGLLITRNEKTIALKEKERDLLRCLILQRQTCVQ